MKTFEDSPETPGRARSSRIGTAVLLSILCLGTAGCFNISGETEALRNGLVKSVGAECEPEIEIGIGALTLDLARASLSFLELDADAQTALSAIRGGDVGIYHLRPREQPFRHAQMLLAADKAMSARGWDRIVGVVNPREFVAIYSPQDARTGNDVKLCVIVFERNKLIVVSARSNPEPLLNLALSKTRGRHLGASPLSF